MLRTRTPHVACSSERTFLQSPSRRDVLRAAAGLVVAPAALARQGERLTDVPDIGHAISELERRAGGRLGVCIHDTATTDGIGHRLDERFAMCSTFKLALAALVLREADKGGLALSDVLPYSEKDLVSHAPVTSQHLKDGGMTLGALAEAAQVTSDNVAANLLLRKLGGPAGFTARLRELGDKYTRLDRFETALNLVVAGDEHDTTTPRAMALTMASFLTGDWLTAQSRETLIAWMVETSTGDKRIRAGLPKDWRAGDKTGTAQADAMTDKCNDIAIVFPPGRAPLIVTAFYDSARKSKATRPEDEALLADVGRLVPRTTGRRARSNGASAPA